VGAGSKILACGAELAPCAQLLAVHVVHETLALAVAARFVVDEHACDKDAEHPQYGHRTHSGLKCLMP
jgi:hypothetical protein